jgi:hypothetical protein
MKIVFIIYHDVLDDRVTNLLQELSIDFYTEWENVKGKGHCTDPHLGTRTFPGFNNVRMIAVTEDETLDKLTSGITGLNEKIERPDDKIRLFQLPLERIL